MTYYTSLDTCLAIEEINQPVITPMATPSQPFFSPDFISTLTLFAPMIAAGVSAVITGALATIIPKIKNSKYNKYYNIACQILPDLNNVLASEDTTGYGASKIQKIITETIKAFADGQLTPDETIKVARLVRRLFDPVDAASAPVTKAGAEILAEIKATPDLKNLDLSGISFGLKASP